MSLFIDNYRCIVYNNKHKDDVEVVCRMGRKSVAVLPQTQAILEQLENRSNLPDYGGICLPNWSRKELV